MRKLHRIGEVNDNLPKTGKKPGRKPGSAKVPGSGGLRTGSPNRATADARKAIAEFVDNNAARLEGWLDRVAEDNPAKAFELFQSVVEYHIPKLARTEHAGDQSAPIQHNLTVKFVGNSDS